MAIEHAILWSNIAFTTLALPTINCAATFLQRSKGTSLSVHVQGALTTSGAPSCNPPYDALSNLLSLISSQRHRIVFIEVIEPSVRFFDAFQGPAENVSRMFIQGRTPIQHSDPFSGKLPNVRQITIVCPGPCRLRSLTNLTQVTLHNGPRGWNIDTFLDFVDGCSSLRSLSVVRYLRFYPGRDSTRTVSLPSLANLRLDNCDTARILSHLKLQANTSVSICTNVKYISEDFNNIFSCIPSEISRINFLQCTRSLTIVFDRVHGDFHVSGFNGITLVFLFQLCGPLTRLDDNWVRRSLEGATNVLPFSDITSLTLVVDGAHVPWDSWLRQSNHISTLDICCPDIQELVMVLNRMRSGVPLCHYLRNLSINISHDNSWSHHANLLKSAIHLRKTWGSAMSCLTMNVCEWDNIRRLDPTWMELVRREGL